ncbi:hypothetical protein [Pontimicrobium aquaticum]|uniref:Uncharacterized protein n=1 Tax=Pontimicrobium aquaticum TaxID=2565367 RepID=A0A4U0F3R8_9FLAO|nr:hypothetical protein [Pontimicrobium aquaticum]TJY37392.1 hypothetical protein E5167_05465 [Pontimicrobium aquaticum]
MKIRILIILTLINWSCNFSEKQQEHIKAENIVSSNSNHKGDPIFPKSNDVKNLFNKSGSSIPFFLIYKKDTCFTFDNICFYRVDLMLKSKEYLNSSIYFGIRDDSLFVGEFYDSKINDALFLLSMNDYSYPREIKNTFLSPRSLDVKSVYEDKKEKVFQIESFYDLPHSKLPKFTFYEFYLSKERGIFRVDVMDESTKEIYSTSNVPD